MNLDKGHERKDREARVPCLMSEAFAHRRSLVQDARWRVVEELALADLPPHYMG